MKTSLYFFLITLFLMLQSSFIYSQNQTDITKIIPGKKYKIVLFDDSEIIGKVISADSVNISIQTESKVMLIIPKSNILYYSTSTAPNKYNYSLALMGGISVFSSNNYYNDYDYSKTTTGPNVNLSFYYYISDTKAIKIDAGYSYLKPFYENSDYVEPMGSTTTYSGGSVSMFSFKGNILIGSFAPVQRLIVYASLGFGINFTNVKELTETYWSQLYPDSAYKQFTYSEPARSEVHALLSLGACLGYRFSKNFGVQAEMEYNLVTGNNSFLIFGDNSYFPIRAGLFYIF